ncbi:MAG: O-antigen ligase family protein [Pirellulales bacterium]|nr:O-antigen ligase family protein [Pirellulales bacterium]
MEVILAIAVLVGLIWGTVLLTRGGLLAGCLAVLLAGCCFGHAFYHLPVGPIPLTLDRVLLAALLGAYVFWRYQGWSESRPLGWAEWALGVFFLVLVASTFLHDWRYDDNAPLAHLLFFYLMPLALYWVARESRLSERGLWVMLFGFALFGIYLGMTAVAEANAQWWAVFPRYIVYAENREFFGRGRGPFLNPVACGYYQAVGLFAAMLLWPRAGRWGRATLVAVFLVFGLGIFYTLTRSVWLGAMLGAMLIVMVRMPRSWRVPAIVGVLLLGTLVATTQWDRIMAFKRDEALSAREAAESVKLRPILAQVAWNMFLDRPLFGCGYGQYRAVHVDYLSDRSTDLPLSKARPYVQHNVFLALLTETGLIGMGLFLVILALWSRNAYRLWRTAMAAEGARALGLFYLAMMAYYLANAMFQDLSLMPQANMLLFFLAGITEAAWAQFGLAGHRSSSPVKRLTSDASQRFVQPADDAVGPSFS